VNGDTPAHWPTLLSLDDALREDMRRDAAIAALIDGRRLKGT
jgi:hypothetical protein